MQDSTQLEVIFSIRRSCAVFVDQELILAFMVRKNKWIKKTKN